MTTVNLLQEPQQAGTGTVSRIDVVGRDDVPSLSSALDGLLADARTGKLRATAPGDRWLALRIEEALRGFDDIQQMAVAEPAPLLHAGRTGTVSISARRVQRWTTPVGPTPESLVSA